MATPNQPAPGSEPLKNARHEAFAVAWSKGGTATDAARVAGYSVARARFTGRDLATNRHVVARKEWFQRQSATATMLTIAEKREFIARLVRSRITETPDDSDLWQEIRITEDATVRKMPDKLRAIIVDNDLSGEGAEAGANTAVADSLAAALRKRARR